MRAEWILLLSALNASLSQVLLKISANQKERKGWAVYLNPYVVAAYGMLGVSMLMDIFAFTRVDYKWGPVLASSSYVFVLIFARLIFKEKMQRHKLIGAGLILSGLLLFSL